MTMLHLVGYAAGTIDDVHLIDMSLAPVLAY